MKSIKILSVILVLIVIFSSCSFGNKGTEKETTEAAAESTKAPVVTTTEAPTTQLTTSVFEKYHTGISVFSDTENIEILAELVSDDGMLYLYERTADGWNKIFETSAKCGLNGMSYNMYEGNKCTPLGLFKLDTPFGIQDAPEGVENYMKVTDTMYWVDDPDSKYYNMLYDSSKNDDKDWDSAEHLIDYDRAYAYGMVIEVNVDPIVPGVTSAIFLHCGENDTLGCVAVPRDNMVKILQLTSGKNSYILIR